MREYGTAWRRAGCFSVSVSCTFLIQVVTEPEPQTDRLMLADPKAMKHILHDSGGYHYPKSAERAQFISLVTGNGIVAAQGCTPLKCFRLQLTDTSVQARPITVSGR